MAKQQHPLTLCDKCVGALTSPDDNNGEDAGDEAYSLLPLYDWNI